MFEKCCTELDQPGECTERKKSGEDKCNLDKWFGWWRCNDSWDAGKWFMEIGAK